MFPTNDFAAQNVFTAASDHMFAILKTVASSLSNDRHLPCTSVSIRARSLTCVSVVERYVDVRMLDEEDIC